LWDDEQRQRYANDPDVLLSVEDKANQAKGDKGPEAWKPPKRPSGVIMPNARYK
jgi:hypothetical protein